VTKEAIIRAIAPECGWNPIPETIPAGQEEAFGFAASKPKWWFVHQLPDYYDDLNDCRDAYESLPTEGKVSKKAMRFWLWEVAGQMCALCSPPQFCEAFLRMKGKWIE
jgi:hypothetical protein